MLRFKRIERIFMPQCQPDIIQPLNQAELPERINFKGGFEPRLIKTWEHHAGIGALELRDRVGPPFGLAKVQATQSVVKFAGEF